MHFDKKVRFKLDNGLISAEYKLIDILDVDTIYEDLEVEHGGCDGNCTNESNNFCECGGAFDDNSIIEIIFED